MSVTYGAVWKAETVLGRTICCVTLRDGSICDVRVKAWYKARRNKKRRKKMRERKLKKTKLFANERDVPFDWNDYVNLQHTDSQPGSPVG